MINKYSNHNPSTQECIELAYRLQDPIIDFSHQTVLMPYCNKGDSCILNFSKQGDKIHYTLTSNNGKFDENTITYTSQKTFDAQVGDILSEVVSDSSLRKEVPEKTNTSYKYLELLDQLKELKMKINGKKIRFMIEYRQKDNIYMRNISLSKENQSYHLTINGKNYTCNNLEDAITKIKDQFSDFLPNERNGYEGAFSNLALEKFQKKMKTINDFFHYLNEIEE